jgi:hypothetical protein
VGQKTFDQIECLKALSERLSNLRIPCNKLLPVNFVITFTLCQVFMNGLCYP